MFVVNLWEADAAVRIATYHPSAHEHDLRVSVKSTAISESTVLNMENMEEHPHLLEEAERFFSAVFVH